MSQRHRELFVLLAVVGRMSVAGAQPPDSGGIPALALDGLPPRARAVLERAYDDARRHSDDGERVGQLAMLLHAHDQAQSAERAYRLAAALEPQAMRWRYLLGVVRAEVGDRSGAIEAFEKALAIEAYLPARLALADALLGAGDADAAFRRYSELVRDYPELALAHYGLGRSTAMRGETDLARTHYQRAVELLPQFGAAQYALALAYRNIGADERARTHLEAFQHANPASPRPPDPLLERVFALRSTARELLARAVRLGEEGRVEESVALHLQALEEDPQASQAHVNLISLYGRLKRPEQAVTHYRAALQLEGSRADAHYNYGVLLASQQRLREAEDAFGRALAANPFHAMAHNNLGALLASQGRLQEAAAHFRQAIASDPGHHSAKFSLGRTLILSGRPLEAAALFERMRQAPDVDTARAEFALAGAWLAAGERAKARAAAERALGSATAAGQNELAAAITKMLETLKE